MGKKRVNLRFIFRWKRIRRKLIHNAREIHNTYKKFGNGSYQQSHSLKQKIYLKIVRTCPIILLTPCLARFDAELAVAKSTQGSRSSSVVFAGACRYSLKAWHVSKVMLWHWYGNHVRVSKNLEVPHSYTNPEKNMKRKPIVFGLTWWLGPERLNIDLFIYF